jgi:hypothetical protein
MLKEALCFLLVTQIEDFIRAASREVVHRQGALDSQRDRSRSRRENSIPEQERCGQKRDYIPNLVTSSKIGLIKWPDVGQAVSPSAS